MNRPLFGMALGAGLGILDGLTAWFTPERTYTNTRSYRIDVEGRNAGICIGWFARKVRSLPLGILFGLAIGMFLAYLIAAMPQPLGKHYYFAIMLPGSLVGAIVGYATQKHEPAIARPFVCKLPHSTRRRASGRFVPHEPALE